MGHENWQHGNRASFRDDMNELIEEEMRSFQKEFDALYEATLKKDGGKELAGLAAEDVLSKRYLSQLGAHSLPIWLEELDAIETYAALRRVCVADMDKREIDDDDSLIRFMELLTNDTNLEPGPLFWHNIYKVWLHSYAEWASSEFHADIANRYIKPFNEKYEGQTVTYKQGPVKSVEQMKRAERGFGDPSHNTFAGRTLAANLLDVVRGSITATCPRTAVNFVKFVKELTETEKRIPLKVVRVKSSFGDRAETQRGYRHIEINVFWEGGQRAIIGEIQVVLEDFLEVKKRRSLLDRYCRGDFEWSKDDGIARRRGSSLGEAGDV